MKPTFCTVLLLSTVSALASADPSLPTEKTQLAALQSEQPAVPEPPTGNQPSMPPGGFPAEIPANAPPGGRSNAGTVSSAAQSGDLAFVDAVARSASAEALASAVELQHTKDPKMEEFAKQLLSDSSEISQTLKPIAASKRMSLPAGMSEEDRSKLHELGGMEASAMDRQYVALYGVARQKAILDLFDKAAVQAKDADIKAFASRNLPKVKRDLEEAQKASMT